uniref:UBC core domain-containing protein n=1 Tax=Chromera velia CCMP2878 TaxID=1169474 RepID=A0A0G4GVI6_9ALVE|mmetsp:Transcript_34628/g.68418  ORF Transcript_34628/g.68418 Transcript_34628/m.68418 type:complete len:203 (+) Transcript_34628:105-713(+)|eukprot:Cvel_23573.t1-p1 / transcript=Cvel_23573.t1 / gene=Cvel_23573 / organism=Chromera_velia_CCMP2878 / gene_product=Probable ubiquitin-conjugating enzyme E2 16, putative / transcript_product=Probable ubiquitin-conjugating enzyme E2 16, putative / location=Cvel_scaffold2445:10304-12197(-) / protein_length=202 / sequence_SO=supercontig / SO=protein_coding / is_pseudo=false
MRCLYSVSLLLLVWLSGCAHGSLFRRRLAVLPGVGKKSGGKKKADATSNHLKAKWTPGNPNYRIQKELKEFIKSPPPNCRVSVGSNLRAWIITIKGVEGTLYEKETYKLKVVFPDEYPLVPPSVYFLRPAPRHPHVYTNGDICLNLLGTDWKPTLTVSAIALAILSMLSSAKEKKIPLDNAAHAEAPPGGQQHNWMYHDDKC